MITVCMGVIVEAGRLGAAVWAPPFGRTAVWAQDVGHTAVWAQDVWALAYERVETLV